MDNLYDMSLFSVQQDPIFVIFNRKNDRLIKRKWNDNLLSFKKMQGEERRDCPYGYPCYHALPTARVVKGPEGSETERMQRL
jgi:hypothetical protein